MMTNRNYPMGSLNLWLETESEIESISSKLRKGGKSVATDPPTAPSSKIPYPEFLIRCKKLSTPDKIYLLNRKIRYSRDIIRKETHRLDEMKLLKLYLKEKQ